MVVISWWSPSPELMLTRLELLLFSARHRLNLCCVSQYARRFDIHPAPRCEKLGNEFFGNPLWTHPEWKQGDSPAPQEINSITSFLAIKLSMLFCLYLNPLKFAAGWWEMKESNWSLDESLQRSFPNTANCFCGEAGQGLQIHHLYSFKPWAWCNERLGNFGRWSPGRVNK